MKSILLATTALAGYFVLRAVTGKSSAPVASSTPSPEQVPDVTRRFLMNLVMPIWLAAGIADWLCHRATSIETTTGPKESVMHLLMLTEAAIPVLGGMFLEITSPVLALMIIAALVHDATALWDVSYAVTKREVTPVEQHVHSFLEMVPLMAISFVSVLHWPQFLALFGVGPDRPDWSLRWKSRPLPAGYTLSMLTAQVTLEWLPYLEELARTISATRYSRQIINRYQNSAIAH
jgi:hypothetical protein